MDEEKFSLIKFFSGFGKPYKIVFIVFIILAYNFVSSKIGTVKREIKNSQIQNYNEASQRPRVDCYGLKFARLGMCVTWEHSK